MIGKTVGNFEILAKIGEGGMGEVYRARDSKLDREVALKVLPREMSGDPERIARFQREARTLATLQHPNVASVYGFEETPEARFLVMELVEGEDLSERLVRGALSIEDAVAIARQLTEGLEAAHERNIVHRDLKPANIKLDPDGAVKILDFGLARAYTGDPDGSEEDLAHSPTITAAMTQAGTILGTAAYMSPEQAKGKRVDKRADIWAFGAIIYEMLTGRRLFEAETISETIAGVLILDIDWDQLPPQTPPSLRVLMERCLQKDPRLRLRDVGEARIVLADPTATIAMQAMSSGPDIASSSRRVWPWAIAVIVALAIGIAGGTLLSTAPPAEQLPGLLFDIHDPSDRMIVGSLAISPSGEHLVFARRDTLGGLDLWIRRMDEEEVRPLPGTRNGRHPFWSTDSQHIGFFTGNELYRTSLDGSAASQIASFAAAPMGGTWSEEDVILVGSHDGPIQRLSASGGGMEPVTRVEPEVEETHCWPAFLPDGRHFVFLADASDDEGHRLWVHALDGSEKKILQKAVRTATLVDPSGALLMSHNSQLFARPFDFDSREFAGPQVLVQDRLQPFNRRHELPVTISANGILAFQSGSNEAVIARVSLADGSHEEMLPQDRYRNPRLSPDGRKIAFEVQGSTSERLIWVQDLERGTRTLVSPRGAVSDSPVWSADGEYLFYGSSVTGDWVVYRKKVYGGAPSETIGRPEGTTDIGALDISADGMWLLTSANPATGWDLWVARIDSGEIEWTPWLVNEASSNVARFSPDSKWIAYEADGSGQPEVYVSPFEGGAAASQMLVSVSGGTDPAWSRDGTALYYRDSTNTLMRVAVQLDDGRLSLGTPERLWELVPPNVGYLRNVYDPMPDGESVVAFLNAGGRTPAIRVRTGWRNR